jgi:hypothetical protein
MDSAKNNTEILHDKKQKQTIKNHDIRSFFNKEEPIKITSNKRIMKVIQPYINEITQDNYKLRARKIVNYKKKFEPSDDDDEEGESNKESESELELEKQSYKNGHGSVGCSFAHEKSPDSENNGIVNKIKPTQKKTKKRKRSKKHANNTADMKKRIKKKRKEKGDENENDSMSSSSFKDEFDIDYIELRGSKTFNKLKSDATKTIGEAELEIKKLEREFYANESKINENKSSYPDNCIPICVDIREFKFKALADKQMELTGQLFDVIMMDPPWQLSSSQPTRGVAIAYDTLNDNVINDIPVEKLQTDGFIFIWTINAKFKVTLDLIKQWGYK